VHETLIVGEGRILKHVGDLVVVVALANKDLFRTSRIKTPQEYQFQCMQRLKLNL